MRRGCGTRLSENSQHRAKGYRLPVLDRFVVLYKAPTNDVVRRVSVLSCGVSHVADFDLEEKCLVVVLLCKMKLGS